MVLGTSLNSKYPNGGSCQLWFVASRVGVKPEDSVNIIWLLCVSCVVIIVYQYDAVASGDVPLAILRRRLSATNDLEKKFKIIDEMKSIIKVLIHIKARIPSVQKRHVQWEIVTFN